MRLLVYDYEENLAELASQAIEIKILIAFLTRGGLNWLPKEKAKFSEFIVGIDLSITDPAAINYLIQNNANVFLFSEKGKMFHPKAFYFRTELSEYLIIGSNNLTNSGISSNHELSLLVTKTDQNVSVFEDFLAHFDYLRNHDCCFIPDDDFFSSYVQTRTPEKLHKLLDRSVNAQVTSRVNKQARVIPKTIDSLGNFISLLASEFPKLNRNRSKGGIKSHELKLLNDKEFRPLLREIVSQVSNNRLDAVSNLNIGGNWYRIPNILAVNESAEPWNKTKDIGRLALQIHFDSTYQFVYISAVLQYNVHRSNKNGLMPKKVLQRYQKLEAYSSNYAVNAIIGRPQFHHWNYKDNCLWGKPIISFEHKIEELPENEALLANLETISRYVNASSNIH